MLCIDAYFDTHRIVSYLRVFGCLGLSYDHTCAADVARAHGVQLTVGFNFCCWNALIISENSQSSNSIYFYLHTEDFTLKTATKHYMHLMIKDNLPMLYIDQSIPLDLGSDVSFVLTEIWFSEMWGDNRLSSDTAVQMT